MTLIRLQASYRSLGEQGTPEVSQLLAEKDGLKDKNEKLKAGLYILQNIRVGEGEWLLG